MLNTMYVHQKRRRQQVDLTSSASRTHLENEIRKTYGCSTKKRETMRVQKKFLVSLCGKQRIWGKNFVFDERMGEKISEEVIARCHQCGQPCDTHINCANAACHILFIQCEACAEKYHQCCSKKCSDFIQLPEEQQQELRGKVEFNGTKFGKGRYKAIRKDEELIVE